jgi:hypothetical protein
MNHDELLAKIDQIIAFEAPRPIKENIWEIGGYLSALALRAVVELHKPYKTKHFGEREYYLACYHCEEATIEGDAYQLPYPCPTIQAIEKELG